MCKAVEECISKLLIHSNLQAEADVLTQLTAYTLMHVRSLPQHTHDIYLQYGSILLVRGFYSLSVF